MGRRSTVESLPDEQLEFVILAVLDQKTDREISARFLEAFDQKLPKSSLNNWRNMAGNELADRYRLVRLQARQLREDLKLENADDYQNVIKNIEERLLTATREVIHQDPMKLLVARQEEERLRIKRETLDLKREQIALERQKLLGTLVDPAKQAVEFLTEFFDYLKDDGDGVLFIKKHVKPFIEFLTKKYGEAN